MFKIWQKLKCVKNNLKALHNRDFARLDDTIDGIGDVQTPLVVQNN